MKTTPFIHARLGHIVAMRTRLALTLLFFAGLSIGSYAQCETDSIAPTVVCRDLHTTFMPGACMVKIWASDLVTSAIDNETPQEKLKIRFNPSGTMRSIELFGEDGLEQIVPVYVMDWCRNQTVCYVKVIINDNEGNCVPNVFDLSLKKSISSSTPGPYTTGSTVTFNLDVTNDGSQDAYRVGLTDYIPEGLTLSDTSWTIVDSNAVYNDPIPLLASRQSTRVSITFTIDEDFEGSKIVNIAEISSADNDTEPNNAPPTDEDSTPSNQMDTEDDQDMAMIQVQKFDLAIKKQAMTSGLTQPGDTIDYQITIYNQGTIDATGVVVRDLVPDYMTNVSTAWEGDSMTVSSIPAGDSVITSIRLRVNPDFQGTQAINNVEIIDWDQPLEDEDSDRALDCAAGVVGSGEVDDDVNDLDYNNVADTPADADECDHAVVTVGQVFDLALVKRVKEEKVYNPGDTVTYVITVYNQGSQNATNVIVSDLPPEEMTIVDSEWSNGTRVISEILSGDSATIEIDLLIDPLYQGSSLINSAEIIDASNPMNLDDEDSSLDTLKCIAGEIVAGEVDDEISDNFNGGMDNPADADECDYAVIDVEQRFDLALRKRVADDRVYNVGDTVQFIIEVHNQGTVDAKDVVVRDIPSTHMTVVDPDWTADNKFTIDSIARGEFETITIDVRIDLGIQNDSIINNAEIEGGDDDSDPAIDCIADSDNDQVDDSLTDDVDECDYAVVRVAQTFDLALRKRVVTAGSFDAGDTVEYSIEVFNQGTVDATGVVVKDYISQHMTLISGAAANGDIAFGDLDAGQSATRNIRLRISPSFTGFTINNIAEITSATNDLDLVDEDDDIADIDCQADVINAGEIDDEIMDMPDNVVDVDDCDFATILVGQSFDLAVRKVARGTSFSPGDIVTYDITVFNQGIIDATDIVLKDFVSVNMTNIDSATSWVNDQASIDSLASGDSVSLTIRLQIDEEFQGDSIINNVEIISSANQFNAQDEDSDPAEDCVADQIGAGEIDDDINDTPDNPADADECDFAVVKVTQTFDLAVEKRVVGRSTYSAGDTVTYSITVYNQGSVDATDIELTDYIPDSMTLVSTDWPGAKFEVEDLAAGESETVQIRLAIHPDFSGEQLINNVEITAGSNALGLIDEDDDLADIDCQPNVMGINEIDNEINDNPDDSLDVDDCDFEIIRIDEVCVVDLREWCGYSVVTCAGGANSNEAVAAILDMSMTKNAERGDDWAAPSTSGADVIDMTRPASWVFDTLGQVFGTALGESNGNIYLAATNVYAYDAAILTPHGVGPGGEQGIYKANFSNPGQVDVLVTTRHDYTANPTGDSIPGKMHTIPQSQTNRAVTGWGNITYNDALNILYATNLSDGRIYVIEDNNGTGIIRQALDPFGGTAGFLSDILPVNQALWAIEMNDCTNQVFFSQQTVAGGGHLLGADGPVRVKNIYSLDINPDGTLDSASLKLELVVNRGTREKLTDIDFSAGCNRMVIAERGRVHNARTMLYERMDTSWNFVSDISVGSTSGGVDRRRGLNSAGGVSFGADMVGEGMSSTCDTVIWSMGDCLDAGDVPNTNGNGNDCNTYGPQGVFLNESNLSALAGSHTADGIFVGLTSNINVDPRQFKFGIGDIEVFNCCCPDEATTSQLSGMIAGDIETANGQSVAGVQVEALSTSAHEKQMTETDGHFAFSSMLMHEDYTITPTKVDHPLSGVSTMDLLLIQQHILGLRAVASPYDLMAADINGDHEIDAKDLIALRRLLLGKVAIEPTAEAWRFSTTDVETDYALDYRSSYTYTDLDQDMMSSDFVAIKVGDVNRSLDMAVTRSSHQLVPIVSAGSDRIDFYLTEDTDVTGMQLAIELPYGTVISRASSEQIDITDRHYHISEQVLTLSTHRSGNGIWGYDSHLPLFSIEIDAVDRINTADIQLADRLSAEVYTSGYREYQLTLGVESEQAQSVVTLDANVPNPFSRSTEIGFTLDEASDVRFEFYSVDGALLHVVEDRFERGQSHIVVDRADLAGATGTIFYQMITDRTTLTSKMIVIE